MASTRQRRRRPVAVRSSSVEEESLAEDVRVALLVRRVVPDAWNSCPKGREYSGYKEKAGFIKKEIHTSFQKKEIHTPIETGPGPGPGAAPPDRRFSIAGDDDAADSVGDEADEPSAGAASAASILASVAARSAVARATEDGAVTGRGLPDRRFSIDGDDEDDDHEIWRVGAAGAAGAGAAVEAYPAALALGAATSKLTAVAPGQAQGPGQRGRSTAHRRLGLGLMGLVSAILLLLGAARLALVFL
ncbi:tRNA 5-methylaminomethyl-2-thiouridine biosynthesis bifunctional protein MnmC [Frankliniella fusca]|uniref:tRNA 5-methylaminomethyl-2-thiouridine biosynthesis bifunctional protein MnmC n=1 Tax=Frankliniella fusca TaxID=407009 RepID=A0AAE1HDY5_9NEOP|nr:tRNA 5-methylaminomethyl-2-thiouridine biosynthesis bifunctional protein MnmC [Frankliniella fusca]